MNFNFRDSVAHRYWQYFGTYIWFVIIGLRPLGQFLCAIVEEQLQEALLVMPVPTRCFSRNVSELQLWEDGVRHHRRGRERVYGSRERASGPRNASKRLKITKETTHFMLRWRRFMKMA